MIHLDETTQAVLRLGSEASDLLVNPAFVALLNEMSAAYLRDIVDTQAHETRTREDRYLRIKVLQDITTELNQRVAAAERAEALIRDAYDPDTEET